ncbi:MAG: hypothetical protein Q8J92_14280 [Parvibaculum sp.]|nr:hypothetical protein [Parvibaculum sp.]
MADDDEKTKPTEIRFTPSLQVSRYLDWLSRNTVLGKNPNEVAEQILVQRLSEMRREDYSDGGRS